MDNIDGKILMLLDSGKTLREIIDEGDFNQKAYIHMNRKEINEMIKNWRQYNAASTKDQTDWISNPNPAKKYNSRSGLYISS